MKFDAEKNKKAAGFWLWLWTRVHGLKELISAAPFCVVRLDQAWKLQILGVWKKRISIYMTALTRSRPQGKTIWKCFWRTVQETPKQELRAQSVADLPREPMSNRRVPHVVLNSWPTKHGDARRMSGGEPKCCLAHRLDLAQTTSSTTPISPNSTTDPENTWEYLRIDYSHVFGTRDSAQPHFSYWGP